MANQPSTTRQPALERIASIWRDHALAARRLAKNTGFTIVVALTLGLAIGGNAAIFSVVSGVLLKPLPYPDPEQLVRIFAQHPRFTDVPLTLSDLHAFRQEQHVFQEIAAYHREGHEFSGSAGPENLEGLFVSAGYFELLGASAALGRTFGRDDERPGVADRVVLSDRLWRTRMGADPSIIGRTINLSRRPFVVVGVMPPGVEHVGGKQRSLAHGETADFWIPLTINPANLNRAGRFLNTVARVRAGVSVKEANAELERLARLQEQQWPETHASWRATAVPLMNEIVGPARPVLLAIFGAVAAVLLIACGNVACLTLARSIGRSREHAVRAALGASRGRLAREIFVESWLLALLGACLGVPLAIAGVQALIDLAPPHLPRLHAIRVDAGMLLFGIVLTFATGLLCGVLPAWYGGRTNLENALREGGRTGAPGGRSLGWHRALVVAQIALCFVLLTCAGLLARTFYLVQRNPVGFRTDGVLTATFDLPGAVTRYGRDVAERAAFHQRLLTRLREEPAVISAGSAARLPFAAQLDSTDSQGLVRFMLAERPAPPDARPFARMEIVSTGYLETLGVPILEGRAFDARDRLGSAPVALVSQELVRRYFPGEALVGKRFADGRQPPTIIGVVGDVKAAAMAIRPEPIIYIPLEQSPLFRTRLAVRTNGDPQALLPMLQRVVSSIDPELPLFEVKPLAQIAADAVATQRFALLLFGLFAALALGLSVIGVYGVLAYAVAHRLPEFGVRAALGASPGQLLAMVLRQGVGVGSMGIAMGIVLSLLVTRSLRSLLFGVRPFDVPTLASVAALFAVIVLAVSLLPARRAARVDPMTTLRSV
jgi:putative ABC transport system permease protein